MNVIKPALIKPLSCGLLVAVSLVAAGKARSANWESGGGISVGAVYTDNDCLDKDNKKDEVFATWTPNLRLSADGARASFGLYAAVQYNNRDDSDEDCGSRGNTLSPAPRIRFSGQSELVENWLYLDASAFGGVNRANPFEAGGADSVEGGDNLNRTYRYSVSPYVYRRFGESASVMTRYRYTDITNSKHTINDRHINEVMGDIGTDPALARFSYGIAGDYSKVYYDERYGGEDLFNSELSSARIRAAYQLTRSWQINGYVGEEWNDFITVYNDDDGTIWDVGATWTPNPRITVAGGVGERFFGTAPRFSLEYRHKRSTLSASYSRNLTYDSSLRTSDFFGDILDDLFGEDPTGDDIVVGVGGVDTTVTNSPIIDERSLLNYRFNGRRTTLSVRASYSEQKRTEDRLNDNFTYVSTHASRRLSQDLSVFAGVSWHHREPDSQRITSFSRNSDLYRYSLGTRYKLGAHFDATFSYEYSDRDADNDDEEYEENRVVAKLNYHF